MLIPPIDTQVLCNPNKNYVRIFYPLQAGAKLRGIKGPKKT